MKRKLYVIGAIILLVVFAIYTTFMNEQTFTVTVNHIEKIERTSGSKDYIDTDVYYLLSTDKGLFRVSISGILAHPEYVGVLKIDSVYEITTCGASMPILGFYPSVINVKK